ncbi:hypothetical protein TNCV_2176711 [Trichonephila clavipes]|uniref:Uncharacterized protein n=1 Tax=Trichonephila clavipes TaxID=2585209 RepID=A0A8X7B7F5_TRICX|nr:hypothetical protein TNCV_2176711 [Trichonephila clavipes]
MTKKHLMLLPKSHEFTRKVGSAMGQMRVADQALSPLIGAGSKLPSYQEAGLKEFWVCHRSLYLMAGKRCVLARTVESNQGGRFGGNECATDSETSGI